MPVNISESREHILNFLKDNSVAVLATTDKNCQPHSAAIYYHVDENINLYFITKRDTTKSNNIHSTGKAAITVFEAKSQTTVQAIGKVSEENDINITQKVFNEVLRKSMSASEAGVPPISKLQAGPYVVYCFTPDSLKMASFIRPDGGSQEKIFETA